MTTIQNPGSPPLPLRPSVSEQELARRRRNHNARRAVSRWIKRGLLGAVGLAAVTAIAYAWMPKPVIVDVATVSRGPLRVFVHDDGQTRVRERFTVAAPLGGALGRIEIEPGDEVTAGTVIAQIVPPEPILLDRRSKAEAEARLAAAIGRERQAVTRIAAAQTTRDLARIEAGRARQLHADGVIAASERDRAVAQERITVEDVGSAELQHRIAIADVATARAALGVVDQTPRQPFEVTAPAAGRVLRRWRESAGPVVAGEPLVDIGDPGEIEAVIDVLSSEAIGIAAGAPVELEQWGGPQPLTGTVRRVEPSAFTRISALGVEEQRVNVIVAVDAPPEQLGDGFRVETAILVWQRDDTLVAPASAVFRERDGWAVYAVIDGHARRQTVDIGQRAREWLEITSGVAAGTVLVLYPSDQIHDGVAVRAR